ncbi:hypothetical protein BH24ACT15_BH24ACT15_05860 [soil metagenome]
MPDTPAVARAMHGIIEPFHAILYFAPEAVQGWERLGLEPRGQGYVAGRAAPLGAVGPRVAAAIFYNFNPAMFDAALPAAWELATPAQVLAARAQAIQDLYTRIDAPTQHLAATTDVARRAADATATEGRPLAAANKAVDLPGMPFADLWQALTVVREHRGDGHVALLTAEGLTPVEALVLYAGWQDTVSQRFLQKSRMWDDQAWGDGEESLRQRGLLDSTGLTGDGRSLRDHLERRTDQLALPLWDEIGREESLALFDGLLPLVQALNTGQAFPRTVTIPDRPVS